MLTLAKTIQIFLPSGDPTGIRVAEITTRIVQAIEVPRNLLQDFLKMPEAQQVAVYFLFGESEDTGEPRVYIGQSGGCGDRLQQHNKSKDFWNRAVVLISRTNSLTQTHGLFLEWHCIQEAKTAKRYSVENGNGGSKPYTPPPLEADCLEIFDTGKALLATLGQPLFDPVAKPIEDKEARNRLFYCKASNADARGEYTSEGFVVLKGSRIRAEVAPSFKSKPRYKLRLNLIDTDVLRPEGDYFVFERDYLFTAPSAASSIVVGHNSNGWQFWKTAEGRTMDEVIRQQAN